jgi:hypothetical protein
MNPPLPDGFYPFIDRRFALSELAFIEAPPDLEALLKSQAIANGIEIVRGEPVEIRCQSEAYPDATFLVCWPHGSDRIHMLAPKQFATGRV